MVKSKKSAKKQASASAGRGGEAGQDAGPSFAEMYGLQEGASVFQIEGGGLLMMGPANGTVFLPMPAGPGNNSSALGEHPALQARVEALEELFGDCNVEEDFKPLLKQKKEVAEVGAQLEKLARKDKDKGKKCALLSAASDLFCRQVRGIGECVFQPFFGLLRLPRATPSHRATRALRAGKRAIRMI